MTEAYRGDWNKVSTERVAKQAPDPYHRVYPDAGKYQQTTKPVWASADKLLDNSSKLEHPRNYKLIWASADKNLDSSDKLINE